MSEAKSYNSKFKTNIVQKNSLYSQRYEIKRDNVIMSYSKNFVPNSSVKSNVQQKAGETTIIRKKNV